MARRGRRPGDPGTRDAILIAARSAFIEGGFNQTTVTGVARLAGVDAALVYHYFKTKTDLFIEAIAELPYPVGHVPTSDGHAPDGAEIVAAFLHRWESDGEPPGRAFIALAQAVSGSPEAAARLQHLITQRISPGSPGDDHAHPLSDAETARPPAMVGAQLLGIAWARYVLRLEPLASAPLADVADWFGPTIDALRAGRRLGPPAEPVSDSPDVEPPPSPGRPDPKKPTQ